jgi:hypothetical protein
VCAETADWLQAPLDAQRLMARLGQAEAAGPAPNV